jgi:hypothetical protein
LAFAIIWEFVVYVTFVYELFYKLLHVRFGENTSLVSPSSPCCCLNIFFSKTELETVVCSPQLSISYQDFTIWGENAGPGMRFDHKSRMFFPNDYYSTMVPPSPSSLPPPFFSSAHRLSLFGHVNVIFVMPGKGISKP